MKGLIAVQNAAREVAETLRRAELGSVADEIEAEARRLDRPDEAISAVESLAARCHVRDLGDLDVRPADPREWSVQVERLRQKCGRLHRRLAAAQGDEPDV